MEYMMKRLLAEMKPVHEEMTAEMKVQIDCPRLPDGCLARRNEGLPRSDGGIPRIETGQEQKEAESKTDLEAMRMHDLEANPEEIEAIGAYLEVSDEVAAVGTIEALKDRAGAGVWL
jgi:hypothetical protein